MTLHMKGTMGGIRALAQPNARDGGIQPFSRHPFSVETLHPLPGMLICSKLIRGQGGRCEGVLDLF